MNFTIGQHTEQAHAYTNALIDEAYKRKTSAEERVSNAGKLTEAYFEQVGSYPSESVLTRLAWYIVFDEMTDSHPDKITREEYPILSEHQDDTRRKRERAISDVYTGKNDETIGRYKDGEGVKRRIYDYMALHRDTLVPSEYLDLYDALDHAELTPRQRQAIDLVYFEGMTQELAAEVMNVSDRAVRYFISGGIAKLRRNMEKTTS